MPTSVGPLSESGNLSQRTTSERQSLPRDAGTASGMPEYLQKSDTLTTSGNHYRQKHVAVVLQSLPLQP